MTASPLAGTTVGQLHARKIKDLRVVALRSADGSWRYTPDEDECMHAGMTVIFMGSPEARVALEQQLGPGP